MENDSPYSVGRDWKKSQAHRNYQKNHLCLLLDKDSTLPMRGAQGTIPGGTVSRAHHANDDFLELGNTAASGWHPKPDLELPLYFF